MKQKPIEIDEYSPNIYPRKLWVVCEVKGIKDAFAILDNNTLSTEVIAYDLEDIAEKSIAITTAVRYRADDSLGVLVILPEPNSITVEAIAHESVHVADYFSNQLNLVGQDYSEGNEAYAYLVGWSAGCISKSLVEYKKHKNDNRRKQNNVGSRKK